jgi:arginine decarboxylase
MATRESRVAEPARSEWTVQDAADLYQVEAWGEGYFAVGETGRVVVRPDRTPAQELDLFEIVCGLRDRDLYAPVLIRFSDILSDRLKRLHDVFAAAIAENGYEGQYIAVYPIKVNQQRPVVEEVHRHGRDFGFGLEVGSKPELLAVMALTAGDRTPRLIVCNGFKDSTYLEAVILATKLGRHIIPVIESLTELRLLLKHCDTYDVRPRLGVRVKLASQGAGRWKESAGEKSKFGLFASEVVEMVRILRERGMLDCLELVHCHPGSQLHDIRRVKDAVGELAHVYAELLALGADGLRYVNVGGGLGVDYDGSQANRSSSLNYTMEEYAGEVVYRIASVCEAKGVAHPTVISESGRAIAAYQSVLVFDVPGAIRMGPFPDEDIRRTVEHELGLAATDGGSAATDGGSAAADGGSAATDGEEVPQPLLDLFTAYESVGTGSIMEAYHDATQAREQALALFNLGYLSLGLRGLAERLFWATCTRVRDACRSMEPEDVPAELERLDEFLADTYFCNFSVFQSLPDSWAIDQLFPIMPIHRLEERPTRKAVLADLTCDSDGKIDRFTDMDEPRRTLDVHELRPGEDYYMAAFLVGAYQETLGDLHNLFGDTHVVHVRLHEAGGWWIEELVRGDTARKVLEYVQYDVDRLLPELARDCELAVRAERLTLPESRTLLRFYETELNGYTYLLPEDRQA